MPSNTTVPTEFGLSGATGRSDHLALLKDQYFPFLNKWVHVGVVTAKYVAKRRGTMGGHRSVGAVINRLPGSAGVGRFEGHKMPTPRSSAAVNPVIFARNFYARYRWTGDVERAARAGNAVAWAKSRAVDLECGREMFERVFSRKLHSGPYDLLSVIKSYDGGTDVATLYGLNDHAATAHNYFKCGTLYTDNQISVQFVSGTAGGAASELRAAPTYVHTGGSANEIFINGAPDDTTDPDNPTITMNLAPFTDPDAEDLIIAYAERKESSLSSEPTLTSEMASCNGLLNMLTDGTYYTHSLALAKSTTAGLSGLYLRNAGTTRPFSEKLMEVLIRRCRNNSGSYPRVILAHDCSISEAAWENRGDRRFPEIIKDSGWGPRLVFHAGPVQVPYEADWKAMPGVFWGLNPEYFGWYEESAMAPVDKVDERWVADYDAHEMLVHKSGNTECTRPFHGGALDDITYDFYDAT